MARKIPIQGVLYINGKPVENTFNKLYGTTRKLERELKKLKTGTEAWQQKAMEVKKARAAFESVRQEINAVRQSAQRSGNALSRFFKRVGDSMLSFFNQIVFADGVRRAGGMLAIGNHDLPFFI